MLDVGQTAEDFTLTDHAGTERAWSSYRGAPVVVFFYPKANTPGCTKEACAFRDASADFAERGVAIVGLSADTVKRQANFVTKYDLNMPLLADPDHLVLEPWGVWAEKKNYGRTYMGIVRTTYLFDANGVARHVWRNVRVKGHIQAVLDKVDEAFAS